MFNQKQSDCRYGGVAYAAGEDLSLKTAHLVKLNSGKDFVLPESDQDITPYVLVQGADTGYLCGAVPVTPSGNCRVALSGACQPGQLLVATGDGRVTVYTPGATARVIGIAEEIGVNSQHVLLRPVAIGRDGTDGADGAPGAAGADGADGGTFQISEADFYSGELPEAPAELVGKVIELKAASQWSAHGIPLGNDGLGHLALVLAYADGVFTCQSLWNYKLFTAPSGPVSVPSSMVDAGYGDPGYYGILAGGDGYYILSAANELIPFSVAEMSVKLGEAGGKTVLAFYPGV